MRDMIEQVALAIEATMFAPHELPLDTDLHAKYRETAEAAIKAMDQCGVSQRRCGMSTNMPDIVERLREWPHGHKTMIVSEAIDEIKRLRKIELIAEDVVWFDWSGNDDDAVHAIEQLRLALSPTVHRGTEA